MKAFSELFPVVVFFIAYFVAKKLAGDEQAIYWATGIAVTLSVLHISWLLLRRQPIGKMLWVNVGIMVVMGGLTLILHDKRFILVKPTILYWFFALALLLAPIVAGKNLLKGMMGSQIQLPEPIWKKFNLLIAMFLIALGALNLLVAFNFSEVIWLNFKLFGATGLFAVFMIVLSLWWLPKHMIDEEAKP